MSTAVVRVARRARSRATNRPRTPLAQLTLAPGERRLITVADSLVGTQRALYRSRPGATWTRIGWEEISRIDEDRANGGLLVTTLAGGRPCRSALPVPASTRLLAFAQERIAATRIAVTRIAVDGHELWVDCRRRPGTGDLRWLVHLDDALDPRDPELPGKIDRAVAELRRNFGVARQ